MVGQSSRIDLISDVEQKHVKHTRTWLSFEGRLKIGFFFYYFFFFYLEFFLQLNSQSTHPPTHPSSLSSHGHELLKPQVEGEGARGSAGDVTQNRGISTPSPESVRANKQPDLRDVNKAVPVSPPLPNPTPSQPATHGPCSTVAALVSFRALRPTLHCYINNHNKDRSVSPFLRSPASPFTSSFIPRKESLTQPLRCATQGGEREGGEGERVLFEPILPRTESATDSGAS